ncbi:MAG TPA: hypothetical protein VNW06_09045 [Cytophagaceae bacterium]|jgi:hypothetical protein|nr:hypothetical protein [Cytophagaceae bacterium]
MEKTLIQMARENVLADEYGKFDLIESIFPPSVLLKSKPRQVKRMICEKLEIEADQINYKTFISWLSRFRKKHQKQPEKENSPNDWRNFKPSEPVSTFEKDNAVVLKRITY